MNYLRWLITFVLVLFNQRVFCDFLPPNALHLESQLMQSGVTKDSFDKVLKDIVDLYDDRVYFLGGELEVRGYWDSELVNATAQQKDEDWIISLYGGLARRSEITLDGFTLVACHEIGHHVAGFPFKSFWAANEGNSDYFATHACVKELWLGQADLNLKAESRVHPYPKSLCDEKFHLESEQALCYRVMNASFSMAKLLAAIDNSEISWDTSDESVVETTYHQHPSAQCRLATLVQGALCQVEHSFRKIPWNENQMAENSCHSRDGYLHGSRPLCWFRPGL